MKRKCLFFSRKNQKCEKLSNFGGGGSGSGLKNIQIAKTLSIFLEPFPFWMGSFFLAILLFFGPIFSNPFYQQHYKHNGPNRLLTNARAPKFMEKWAKLANKCQKSNKTKSMCFLKETYFLNQNQTKTNKNL